MNPEQYATAIRFGYQKNPQRALLAVGTTGIGKSEIPVSVAREDKIGMVYADCTGMEPTDLTGLPEKDKTEMVVKYFALDMFKPLYTEEKGIFILDELTRLDTQVRHTIMPVLVRRVLPSGHKIKDGWLIVGTANPADEDYQVSELDKALVRRMIVINIDFHLDAWRQWGVNHGISGRVITAAGRLAGTLNRSVTNKIEQICTPYGMEVASDLIKAGVHDMEDRELEFALLAGAVGDTAAGIIQQDLNDQALSKLLDKAMNGEKVEGPHDQLVNLTYLFWEKVQKNAQKHTDIIKNLYECLNPDIRMLLIRLAYDRMVQYPDEFGKIIEQWSEWCTEQLQAIEKATKKRKKMGGI